MRALRALVCCGASEEFCLGVYQQCVSLMGKKDGWDLGSELERVALKRL